MGQFRGALTPMARPGRHGLFDRDAPVPGPVGHWHGGGALPPGVVFGPVRPLPPVALRAAAAGPPRGGAAGARRGRGGGAGARAGGPPGGAPADLRFSPYLVLALTSRVLTGDLVVPDHYVLVGPALSARPATEGFPWDRFNPARRHVLVTVGTLAEDVAAEATDFYVRAVDALRPLGARGQGIGLAPEQAEPDPPEHVMIVPRIPQLELMPRLDAVVGHGGQDTVCRALRQGVPPLIPPLPPDH